MSDPTLEVRAAGSVLHVTLNQPATRNALSAEMVRELRQVAEQAAENPAARCIVLRGAGGNFCAGGNFDDFRKMMQSRPSPGDEDPIVSANRDFGRMLQQWQALPQVVIAVVEGAAMGGGVGLAAVSDIVLAEAGAQFAMPEVALGLPPAQIAPFVAARLGDACARRLALTAARIGAREAKTLGLVHEVTEGAAALEALWRETAAAVLRGAPGALAATKAILALRQTASLDATLDAAAVHFSRALREGEAEAGVRAFREKRPAPWVERPQ